MPADESHQTQTRQARGRAELRSRVAAQEFAVLRLAVGLGMAPDDPYRAARLAGVLVPGEDGKMRAATDAEVDQLLEDALGESHAAIREGRGQALVNLVSRFATLNAISLLEGESLLQPRDRAFATRLAQQVIRDLGGHRKIFTSITTNLGKPRK